jgi:hypothetical protein
MQLNTQFDVMVHIYYWYVSSNENEKHTTEPIL